MSDIVNMSFYYVLVCPISLPPCVPRKDYAP